MAKYYYASLTGPLLRIYYPLPFTKDSGIGDIDTANRMALNTSKLKGLWYSIYTEEEVKVNVERFGGIVLPKSYANKLDYDTYAVNRALECVGG